MAPSASTAERRRFHELDGLRALAICLVVFHHSFTSSVVRLLDSANLSRAGTFTSYVTRSGVELFFVLSGVVLLRPYLRHTRPFHTVQYLRRRSERLWPPYMVALAIAGVVVAVPQLHPTWYSREVLPVFSLGDWLAQSAIINLGWPTYSGAWWSLTLEVIFYLLAPVLVGFLLIVRSQRAALVSLALAAIAASLVSAWVAPDATTMVLGSEGPDASRPGVTTVAALFFLYFPCFVMGAILASHTFSARIGLVLLTGGAAYCVVALFAPALNIHLGFAFVYGGLVVMAMEGTTLRHWLSRRSVVWLGERSYSLFLIHFPIFYLVSYLVSFVVPTRDNAYLILTRSVGLPLALFVSMVMFWLVERRFARGLTTADQFWPWTLGKSSP